MNELALFAGAGGGILGGHLLGWRTVCAVEWEPYPASVLIARQNDGILQNFPIWDDVRTFDGRPWRDIVDVVSGGFPCQDISAAGKGAGITGARSGLWKEFARIISEVRPRYTFIENSPMLTIRGLETVLCDLAEMGFDAEWGIISAADVGAPHLRERIWVLATNTSVERCDKRGGNRQERHVLYNIDRDAPQDKSERERWKCGIGEVGADVADPGLSGEIGAVASKKEFSWASNSSWWKVEPGLGRVANGVAARVDRLKAIGNGQVPLCATTAWRILSNDTNAASS